MTAPFLLRADNFTPATRTPWGGTKILSHYKSSGQAGQVGESWEFSLGPEFPSLCADTGEPLTARLGGETTALLVKLIDAADDLSVQIHPSDAYPGLAPGDAGKPESWYVLAHEPGAAIHFGLRTGVTSAAMRASLETDADVSALLARVEVAVGDFFVIDAGTAHAIGRGVTLVEPQHVAPGKRGITYRFWDWNRRYGTTGQQDPNGRPRELHVDDALAVTDWDAPREDALLAARRVRAGAPRLDAPAEHVDLAGGMGIPNEHLRVSRLSGTGELVLADERVTRALTVVAGVARLSHAAGELAVSRGSTAVLPAGARGLRVRLEGAHAVLSRVA